MDTVAVDPIPVVILNWNGEEDTVECLRSISTSAPAGFLPIIVDNASRSESVERVRRECERIFNTVVVLKGTDLIDTDRIPASGLLECRKGDVVVLIESSENLGFAKGSNLGVLVARALGSEWVMLLNNDTVVAPEMFQELRKFRDENPSFVAITPQIRRYNERTRILNCGGDLTYFGSLKYRFENRDASSVEAGGRSVITFITGCALLFKYGTTGLLTEDFFFGEEDYEFSLRLKKRGQKMACVHSAVVYHKVGTTIGKSSKKIGQILVYYVNRLINTRRYYSTLRWQATRILAYLYLPFLFAKTGIAPTTAFSAVRRVQSYITKHHAVTREQFQALVMSGH